MDKFCNIEIFYKKGERKTFTNISRHEVKKFKDDENAVLILSAYKVFKSTCENEFLWSQLDIYTKLANGSYELDNYETSFECDDPVYLFAHKKIHEQLAQKEDLEKQWAQQRGEYLSSSNQAALR